ncbi:hypothetical protein COEREDRAFT_90153 [Coemansia reversa NRRL 1564]|uniref:Uncharacterized protein n=1 Tax=Coemansia reversa (strain ATCC 12441 / NRRL 1564) TaxID=763665 RepID=A0A2G5B0Q1_COERN|nr:hypothetical protein COEREDRAFT_90153 [Coemansia reversa NRRL 1564]|eukprot:PIA12598.1 hypothetical protein COEREDRAFT_90153 [Coemansia reversa NRRL 1564]
MDNSNINLDAELVKILKDWKGEKYTKIHNSWEDIKKYWEEIKEMLEKRRDGDPQRDDFHFLAKPHDNHQIFGTLLLKHGPEVLIESLKLFGSLSDDNISELEQIDVWFTWALFKEDDMDVNGSLQIYKDYVGKPSLYNKWRCRLHDTEQFKEQMEKLGITPE